MSVSKNRWKKNNGIEKISYSLINNEGNLDRHIKIVELEAYDIVN